MRFLNAFCGLVATVLCGAAAAQINITHTFDLRLGSFDAPEHMMLDFGGAAVAVFSRLPHPTACPTTRNGDFDLKKVNPGAGAATNEPICNVVDTISINTNPVWELHTAGQKVYYLQMVELLEDKRVKVRLTSQMPVLRLTGSPSVPSQSLRGADYLVDGKKPLPKAANILVGHPK
jgi:hypothetical protein